MQGVCNKRECARVCVLVWEGVTQCVQHRQGVCGCSCVVVHVCYTVCVESVDSCTGGRKSRQGRKKFAGETGGPKKKKGRESGRERGRGVTERREEAEGAGLSVQGSVCSDQERARE
ncbi:hypothetical protein NEIG_02629 [Nematocida sp. ERTm5]|nr:hypothetical protein NEIG_02629 [Nematocida sp. ERTm5]